MGCGDEKLSKYLTQTFIAHCNAMICQQVTLSGDAEWPKVADAVIEAWKLSGFSVKVVGESATRSPFHRCRTPHGIQDPEICDKPRQKILYAGAEFGGVLNVEVRYLCSSQVPAFTEVTSLT